MRKLTGYIGAMIIVFALMGSILAGFALNINGQSTVINSYETVTDVSGLYNHTQEKAYIDYNPASNYINYNLDTDYYDNPNGDNEYRVIKNDTVVDYRGSDRHCIINGIDQGLPTIGRFYIITEQFNVYTESYGLTLHRHNGDNVVVSLNSNATFTITGNNVKVTIGGSDYTYTNNKIILVYATTDTDYYLKVTPNKIDRYYNNQNQILCNGYSGLTGTVYGTTFYGTDSDNGLTRTVNLFSNITTPATGIYKASIGGSDNGFNNWCVFYPKSVNNGVGPGIDYSISARVNNYPISNTPSNTSVTRSTIDLMNITATSYWPSNTYFVSLFEKVGQGGQERKDFVRSPSHENEGIHNYKLSDVLANYTIPANTKTIQINADGTTYTTKNMAYANYSVDFDNNIVGFTNLDSYIDSTEIINNDIFGQKDYLIYDLDRGIVDVYSYNGVKKYSNTPDKIMVCFTDTGYNNATGLYYVDLGGGYITSQLADFNFPNDRARPYINLIATSISASSIDYMDITKGIKINPSNNVNVIWDNQYENGIIQLLFRANDTSMTYSNMINISGNDITISYTGAHFYVKLNNDDTVDIGAWRNIVLNIDLNNGKLNVNPVRTFNSYTNVVLDNANIYIGDLTGATPTNIITWYKTNNSLMFNVYSTSVFMDSYGVVMVNPTLNITDYFTDLNNFYRLKLSNFSIYGDSITVNGVTGTVSGNNLTVDDNTLMIKDLAITYADGHAYIEDSNISVDLGAITDNIISLNGVWYFETELLKGITDTKTIYEWDWSQFILDNTQFCVFYMGLALAGVIIARHFCILSITDYAVLIVSFIIALGVQVIA